MQRVEADPSPPAVVRRRCPRGGLILRADSPAGHVYLVRTGQVRVFALAESGAEITYAVLGPGQVFGVAPLLGLPVYRVFAEALRRTEVWALPADRLRRALPQDTALLDLVVAALGRRLALAEALLRDVALLPVALRLSNALARLEGGPGGAPPRLSHEQLAGLIGARRETVSRAAAAVTATPAGDG